MDTLESFIAGIRKAAHEPDPQASVASALKGALESWGGAPPWLGPPSIAELPVWYADDRVTIIHIVWPPHMLTEPHNHNMWATIGLYLGRENNILWQRNGDSITAFAAESVGSGEVYSLGADAIHSVVNPLDTYTAAIHVYGGDFMGTARSEWEPEHLVERPRDMERARRAFAAAERAAQQRAQDS